MVAFVRLGAPIDAPLVVNYVLRGEASNGVDVLLVPGTVTIPAGEYFALVPVRGINDLFVEGNEELIVEVTAGDYQVLEGFGTATLIVVEDDLPLLSIYAADSTMGNTFGTATVTVSRTGTLDRDLVVNYLVTGTATSGATESYYAILFHELTHWSGHASRLDRQLGNRFGDAAYAMEELVAELGK